MVQRITQAPPPRLTILHPGLTACLCFALRAFHLRVFGLCGHRLRFFPLVLLAPVTLGFAFRSSGLSRFSGLWLCNRRGNIFDFDSWVGMGGTGSGSGRACAGSSLVEGYAFLAKTGSGRQRRNNAVRQPIILSSLSGLVVRLRPCPCLSPAMIASATSRHSGVRRLRSWWRCRDFP